jgi:hypothetical protein
VSARDHLLSTRTPRSTPLTLRVIRDFVEGVGVIPLWVTVWVTVLVTVVVAPPPPLVVTVVVAVAVLVAVAVVVTVLVPPLTVWVTVWVVALGVVFNNDSAPAPAMAATTTPAPTPMMKFLRDTLYFCVSSSPVDIIRRTIFRVGVL